jgi:hypothetical protein
LKNIYPKTLNEIQMFIDSIMNDFQGIFTENIINLNTINTTLIDFLRDAINIQKWQNESIEISLTNFENKVHNLFLKEEENLISMKENYTFDEENMNITYFQLKNNLLSPIRKIIYDIYYYEINLEVIHSIINETQKIMREDTLKLIEILKNNLVDKNKIFLLGYEIKIENIIMESLFPKIYDYSTGIFFNYTRYLNSKENRKINISEIKEYLLTKENRINNFIDDEYYFLLQKLREKAKIIIGIPKKEEKYIQPEHEEIEEKEEEEEKKTISFNETDIEDKEVEFEEFDDGTKI